MNSFCNKSGCELTYLASSFAIAISKELNQEEIALLSAFLVAVGDNLAIIANQCDKNKD